MTTPNGQTATTPTPTRFGACLRRFREERGWSQAEIARRSGVPRPSIGRLEAGKRAPEVGTIVRLARALGRDVLVYLLFDAADDAEEALG